jgi:GNAT superfamily N-acetyltransferase
MIEYLEAGIDCPAYMVEQFVPAYQSAFGGPPYFETYSEQEVLDDIWHEHLARGVIILALVDGSVAGFGCALPLTASPEDVNVHLAPFIADGTLPKAETVWYMSELGVLPRYRYHGIGYRLVQERLRAVRHYGGSHFVMRTAAEGSNSLHLYQRAGAQLLPGAQVVGEPNGSKSTSRIYLHGPCTDAIETIGTLVP